MGGIYAVAMGIGEQENANLSAQISTALQGILLAPTILDLNQLYLAAITEDSLNYATDTVAASIGTKDVYDPGGDPHRGTGPHMAAVAAQDNTQKDLDTSLMNNHLSKVQNILDTIKAQAAFLGQNMDNIFEVQMPILQWLEQTISSLKRF